MSEVKTNAEFNRALLRKNCRKNKFYLFIIDKNDTQVFISLGTKDGRVMQSLTSTMKR